MVRNKNPEKSQQEARRGKMSFFAYFKEEFQVIQERDPAIHSPMEVLLYPSFRVMLKYRRAHKLYLKGHYFLARWISQRAARKPVSKSIRVRRSERDCLLIMVLV